jgi:hypothetical protein
MPVQKGKNCVSDEMHRWGQGELHSGVGKKGVDGKVVPKGKAGQKQALAIAINECSHSERLQSMGYSEEVADKVAAMLDFSNANLDWKKQFATGKGPGTETNPDLGPSDRKHPKDLVPKGGNLPKQEEPEMLSGPALEKGPANPQGGSSKDVQGLRMLG